MLIQPNLFPRVIMRTCCFNKYRRIIPVVASPTFRRLSQQFWLSEQQRLRAKENRAAVAARLIIAKLLSPSRELLLRHFDPKESHCTQLVVALLECTVHVRHDGSLVTSASYRTLLPKSRSCAFVDAKVVVIIIIIAIVVSQSKHETTCLSPWM